MLNLNNKDDVRAAFGLATVICFIAGIFYAFDDFNASRGVVWMLGALICQNWKKEIK